jgi:hypothetical protein
MNNLQKHALTPEKLDHIDVNLPQVDSPLQRPIRSIPTATAAASAGDLQTVGIRQQRRGMAGDGRIGDPRKGGGEGGVGRCGARAAA